MSDPDSTAGPTIRDLFPYLIVRDGPAALEFYVRVFGARESFRLQEPGGRIAHAELRFGDATVMLADEHPEHGILSPLAFGGAGSRIHLHVDDVDRLPRRAAEAGATVLLEPSDQPHGERQSRLRDPFGHEWLLGHHVEELPEEEIRRRYEEIHEAAGRVPTSSADVPTTVPPHPDDRP
jgi:uncharacterized glyoxalase superfamily protein PhnB